MRYSRNKEIDDKVKELLKCGWEIKSSNRHLKLKNVVGKSVITVPCSPGDFRSVKNWLQQVRVKSFGALA